MGLELLMLHSNVLSSQRKEGQRHRNKRGMGQGDQSSVPFLKKDSAAANATTSGSSFASYRTNENALDR